MGVKNITFTLIILLVALLLIFFLTLPEYKDLKETKLKIEEKKVELEIQEKYFLEIQGIDKELEKYKDGLLKIEENFSAESPLAFILNFIQTKASENGLFFERLGQISTKPLAKKISANLKETNIELSLLGSYPSFKNFLSVIETSARLIDVESINFSHPQKEGTSFRLTIKTYSY